MTGLSILSGVPASPSLPPGGVAGAVLTKNSSTDGDVKWDPKRVVFAADYGVSTANPDNYAAMSAAIVAARVAAQGTNGGVVILPPCGFNCGATATSGFYIGAVAFGSPNYGPPVSLVGYGKYVTALLWNQANDMGPGKYIIDAGPTVGGVAGALRHLSIGGPAIYSPITGRPPQMAGLRFVGMNGVRTSQGFVMEDVNVSGCNIGIHAYDSHNRFIIVTAAGSYINLLLDAVGGIATNDYMNCGLTNAGLASIGMTKVNGMDGDSLIDVHVGFAPFGCYQMNTNGGAQGVPMIGNSSLVDWSFESVGHAMMYSEDNTGSIFGNTFTACDSSGVQDKDFSIAPMGIAGCTLTNGSATVACTDTNGVNPGMPLSGMMAPPNIKPYLCSTAATGGTGLAANTLYRYVVAALGQGGETIASNEVQIGTGPGATNANTVAWIVVPNATGYKVFRGLVSGAENVMYPVGAAVTQTLAQGQLVVAFVDTGATGTAGTPLATATTTAIPGVPAGAVVQTIVDATHFTMSAPATAAGSNVTLTIAYRASYVIDVGSFGGNDVGGTLIGGIAAPGGVIDAPGTATGNVFHNANLVDPGTGLWSPATTFIPSRRFMSKRTGLALNAGPTNSFKTCNGGTVEAVLELSGDAGILTGHLLQYGGDTSGSNFWVVQRYQHGSGAFCIGVAGNDAGLHDQVAVVKQGFMVGIPDGGASFSGFGVPVKPSATVDGQITNGTVGTDQIVGLIRSGNGFVLAGRV